MDKYFVKLLSKRLVADRTMAFEFSKPDGFEFIAGQYLQWILVNPTENDPRGNFHYFSIASAPYEKNLMLATRLTGSVYKNVLNGLPIGNEMEIKGPLGEYTLPEDSLYPIVYLAGGIGVTPVRSSVLQAIHDGLGLKIFFFHSNRRTEDAPFFDEMLKVSARGGSAFGGKSDNFTYIPSMSKQEDSKLPWNGDIGYINEKMLKKYLINVQDNLYFIDGPPAFVKAMRELVLSLGVEPNNINFEDFTGY